MMMAEQRYEFHLSTAELEYLKQLSSRDKSLGNLIKFPEGARRTIIRLRRSDAQQLRDRLGWHLAIVGFDENYYPTEQGQMLERLIDRLFVR